MLDLNPSKNDNFLWAFTTMNVFIAGFVLVAIGVVGNSIGLTISGFVTLFAGFLLYELPGR